MARSRDDIDDHYRKALWHMGAALAHLRAPEVMAELVQCMREGRLNRDYVLLLRDQLAQALKHSEQ